MRRPGAHPDDRAIVSLAVPALGALAAEPLYVLVDTAVVGHLGTPQLGGLALAGTVLTTAFWLFNFLAYGTTASVGRAVGAGDRRTAAEQGVQALWAALAIGVGLTIVGLATAALAVSIFGASPTVRPQALTYLRISWLGAPAILVSLAGIGYLRGLQNTRTPLAVALTANAVNLVLEVVLIYGLGMGIGASAAATVAAQWGAALVYVALIFRSLRPLRPITLAPDRARLRELAQVGRDLLVRTGSLLAALATATAVAARIGNVSLGAHQIAYQLWTFLALTLDAIAIAGQAMISSRLGAGDALAARRAARRMLEWGLGAGIIFGLAVVAGRPGIVMLFTRDAAVRSAARDVLWLVALLQPVNALVFVLDGILIGAGEFRFLARAMAAASFLVFMPAALAVLHFHLGLVALWCTLGVLMSARLAGNAWCFASERWQVTGAIRSR